jgi:hypothetical protein
VIKAQYESRINELEQDKERFWMMNQKLLDNPRKIENIYYYVGGDLEQHHGD